MRMRNFIPFKTKYKNKSCFVDGVRFDSRREAAYYGELLMQKKAGLISGFKRQVTFHLYAHEVGAEPEFQRQRQVCDHRVDFLVTRLNGDQEVHEVKGFATEVWNLKRKLFEANYPDIPYKVIK